jgi:hypothetical protein
MSEGTMDVYLTINNNDTAELYLIAFSVSPQSSNIETIYDVESLRVDGGTYIMEYTCSSPEFQSTSCKFRIIKPGAFRNMDDPVGTPLDANERKWELYLQYSIIAAVLGGIALLAALFSFVISKAKSKREEKDQLPQQPTFAPPPSSFSSSFSTESGEPPTETEDDPYMSMHSPKNKWVCLYCNTQNDDIDPYCVVCNSKRED